MLPILIIAYLRPEALRASLERFESKDQKFYVFIDYADEKNRSINQEVIECALEFSLNARVNLRVSDCNLGVANAVPTAINWIAESESEFIVLEDDCQLNPEGLRYLNQYAYLLRDKVSLLSATSPWDFEPGENIAHPLSLSSYPLISGWATSASNWKEISTFIGKKPPYGAAFKKILKCPRRIKPITFFLASQIRVYQGRVCAWDSSVALWMSLNSGKSLVPNLTMVTNIGRDQVAAHTLPAPGENTIFRQETQGNPSLTLDLSEQMFRSTDKQIENVLYKMKARHVLSPIKAILEGLSQ
jgi:hypothetical protein